MLYTITNTVLYANCTVIKKCKEEEIRTQIDIKENPCDYRNKMAICQPKREETDPAIGTTAFFFNHISDYAGFSKVGPGTREVR